MSEDLFCIGQKKPTQSYKDGWYRSFKGHPKMSANVLEMLKEYMKARQYNRVLIFFIGKCKYDEDYAGFLLRELNDGNL
jgi:hypothetical protein